MKVLFKAIIIGFTVCNTNLSFANEPSVRKPAQDAKYQEDLKNQIALHNGRAPEKLRKVGTYLLCSETSLFDNVVYGLNFKFKISTMAMTPESYGANNSSGGQACAALTNP